MLTLALYHRCYPLTTLNIDLFTKVEEMPCCRSYIMKIYFFYSGKVHWHGNNIQCTALESMQLGLGYFVVQDYCDLTGYCDPKGLRSASLLSYRIMLI